MKKCVVCGCVCTDEHAKVYEVMHNTRSPQEHVGDACPKCGGVVEDYTPKPREAKPQEAHKSPLEAVLEAAKYIETDTEMDPNDINTQNKLKGFARVISLAGMQEMMDVSWKIIRDVYGISVPAANTTVCFVLDGAEGYKPITLKAIIKTVLAYGYTKAARDVVTSGKVLIDQRKLDYLLNQSQTTQESLDNRFKDIDRMMARVKIGTVLYESSGFGEFFKKVVVEIKDAANGIISVDEPTCPDVGVKDISIVHLLFPEEVGMSEEPKAEESLDFIFLENLHNHPIRCKLWGGEPWLFRWLDSQKMWVSQCKISMEIVKTLPHNLTQEQQDMYKEGEKK